MMDPLAPLLNLADVESAVKGARAAVDGAYRHPSLRREGGVAAAEIALRSAVASASLESSFWYEVELVRAGAVHDPVIQSALRVSEALPSLASRWESAPRQVLAKMHILAGTGLLPASSLGRPALPAAGPASPPASPTAPSPAPSPNPTASPDRPATLLGPAGSAFPLDRPVASSDAATLPPDHPAASLRSAASSFRPAETSSGPAGVSSGPAGTSPDHPAAPFDRPAVSLDRICSYIVNRSGDPLIRAAVVHGEILALNPFPGVNGLIARAAARLTLVSSSFDPRGLIGVEEIHLAREPEYRGASLAFATGTADGIRSWLKHCALAVTLAAESFATPAATLPPPRAT